MCFLFKVNVSAKDNFEYQNTLQALTTMVTVQLKVYAHTFFLNEHDASLLIFGKSCV